MDGSSRRTTDTATPELALSPIIINNMLENIRIYIVKYIFQWSITQLRGYPELDIRLGKPTHWYGKGLISFQGEFKAVAGWEWSEKTTRVRISDQRVLASLSGITGLLTAIYLYF